MSSQTESESTADPNWGDSREQLLRTITDGDARKLFYHTQEPKTVPQLIEECGIPKSSAYRKIEKLVECGLLEVAGAAEFSGNEAIKYQRTIGEVRIRLRDSLSIEGVVFKNKR